MRLPSRLALVALAAVLATLAAYWLDPWVFRTVRYPAVDSHDWGRLLRVVGSLVFWLPLALGLWLEARVRDPDRGRSAWLVLVGPALAGAVAELLKLVVRRERPALHGGEYFYRAFADRPFDTHDLGFPSSHVMVAFGGAAVLARLYPGAGPVLYLLALGCAVTRLLAQGHFLSDVVVAALAGWAIGMWIAGRRLPSPSGTI
ncbi:MAG TPA: phosphatase PAP2 family protein [Gemmatimonadales bacterium]|nr:phosphatase PAP2 family protein [Gemmatimonadales bacterium]